MQLNKAPGRRFIVVDAADNVATLLDGMVDTPRLGDGMPIEADVPFGHKVSLQPIAAGEPVVKYGVEIGIATQDISQGGHVHVHNCR